MLDHGPIQELPLSFFHDKVDAFLRENGLRMDEDLEHYYTFMDPDGGILAGAGVEGDIIKCVAVSPKVRSEGLLTPLLSRIISDASSEDGTVNFKVFTKPENQDIFESLGFRALASTPEAVFMENGRGLENYCRYLRKARSSSCHARPRPDISSGVIVMNANPFTLGHKYLIDKALEQVDHLYIIPVKEDRSDFPYTERVAMIQADASASDRIADASITVLEGCDYVISAATFPTYFLKDLSEAAEVQMRLDLELFAKWIMPALGATMRFVGSEPLDSLTARYNELMREAINVIEIPRLETPDHVGADVMPGSDRASRPVSASAVRSALSRGDFRTASALTPATTHPYLLAALAQRALLMELDTPLKPGLVGPDSCGAHKDMDYGVMLRGISALRPYWSRMALASSPEELKSLGIEAEQAMMAATGGVNTHRGAIFALGLAVNAVYAGGQLANNQSLLITRVHSAVHPIVSNSLTDSELCTSLIGAKRMALSGYRQLFLDWLPYYRHISEEVALSSENNEADAPESATSTAIDKADANRDTSPSAIRRPMLREMCPYGHLPLLMTLLHIMSTLDDTCVIKRVGKERAEQVKNEAAQFAGGDELKDMCARYAAEGISPGGAADMLALTIFFDSII